MLAPERGTAVGLKTPMRVDEIKGVLEPVGFEHRKSDYDYLASGFVRRIADQQQWVICADMMWDQDETDHVDLGLKLDPGGGPIGTVHRVISVATLKVKVPEIVASLETLLAQEELLKCPECGVRWVHLKEPDPGGKQFAPFLSCEGMRKARNRDIVCRGVSRRIPPLVTYR